MRFLFVLIICSHNVTALSKSDNVKPNKIEEHLKKKSTISEKTRGEVKTDTTISIENNPWWPPNSNYETPGNEIGYPWSLLQSGFQLGNSKTCPQEKFQITSHCNYMAGAVKMSETFECVGEDKCKVPAYYDVFYRYEMSGLPLNLAKNLSKLLRTDPTTNPLMIKYRVYHEEKYVDNNVKVALLWFNAIYWQVTGSYTYCSNDGTVETVEGVKVRFPIYTRDRMMEGLFGILDFCQKDAIKTTSLISYVDYPKAETLYDFYCVKTKPSDLSH